MALNVSVKLFCGVELDYHSTDEMDEDHEKHYSQEGVYARHVERTLNGDVAADFDEESLAEEAGLRVLQTEDALYLAIESTVNEVSGNGESKVNVSPPRPDEWSLLVRALKEIGNSKAEPKWLMVTNYG